MLATPNTFPTQNNHRIALFQPDIARTDFDRIEDIGADAIASARNAVSQLEYLPHVTLKPIDSFIRTIKISVDQRRVMTEVFRHATLIILKHLVREERGDDFARDLDLSIHYLRDALNQSHRVQDLLASERDIERQREIKIY